MSEVALYRDARAPVVVLREARHEVSSTIFKWMDIHTGLE